MQDTSASANKNGGSSQKNKKKKKKNKQNHEDSLALTAVPMKSEGETGQVLESPEFKSTNETNKPLIIENID